MLRLSAKKLVFLHLYIDIFVRLLSNMSPVFSVVSYIPDIINCILFVLCILQSKRNISSQKIFLFIGFLLCFDIMSFFLRGESLILFIWGLRNQYRFIFFMCYCIVFLDISDLIQLEKILLFCFRINMIVVTIQIFLGYRRDYLGGTFGIDNNSNGVTNLFLCIVCTYAILGYLKKKFKLTKFLYLVSGALYWTIFAELKILFIEIIIIFFLAILYVKGNELKKIKVFIFSAIGLVLAIVLFAVLYPDQMNYILDVGTINYVKRVNVGIHGFGRFSAIPITNSMLFNEELSLKLFGIGLGNGEQMSFGSIKLMSNFYSTYGQYAYSAYFYAYQYVQRGILGILWYAFLFGTSIKIACKKNNNAVVNGIVIIVGVCLYIIAIYDSSLNTSTGGYIAFCVLAIPYILNKRLNEVKK